MNIYVSSGHDYLSSRQRRARKTREAEEQTSPALELVQSNLGEYLTATKKLEENLLRQNEYRFTNGD